MKPSILEQIVRDKIQEVSRQKKILPVEDLIAQYTAASSKTAGISFRESLKSLSNIDIRIIAEVKRASPSKGILCHDFDHRAIARAYEKAHASALSVLTDSKYFSGEARFITEIKALTTLPVLRKDFIIDPYQIHESRAIGADAVLLIAAALDNAQLQDLTHLARSIDLDYMVEIHDERELNRVMALNDPIIGVNNRDLHTFDISLDTVVHLSKKIIPGRLCVSESGILTHADLAYVTGGSAVRAFLIGEGLVNGDVSHNMTSLVCGTAGRHIHFKICGITSLADAQCAVANGFETIGFVFYPKSPRYITPEKAREISLRLSPAVNRVGLFVNAPVEEICRLADEVHLDFIQLHGNETPGEVNALRRQCGLGLIKAVSDEPLSKLDEYTVDYFLIDHQSPKHGGTGQLSDWAYAREVSARFPVILAGGINASNIHSAWQTVTPRALDVSSGVESRPGKKDEIKIRRLAQAWNKINANHIF